MTSKSIKKAETPPPPSSIGPYSIVRNIGRGGMGEVFLARDPSCSREVAVKRIRPDLVKNQTILRRFLREAHIASQLTHPAIIPILSIQNAPPEIYYTMPYVGGETLKQILRPGTEPATSHPIGRSIPALARIFLQICEAIAYTHSKGILHRDLKPENIIVGTFGEVRILDWGIADYFSNPTEKFDGTIKAEPGLTHPGKIAGTLAYMAPERLSGKISIQADLYALGVILYFILTLQLPFQRKTIASFRKQKENEKLIDPIEASPYRDIPLQLSEICKKCLAYDPKQRFATVDELIVELKKYNDGHAQWIPIASLDAKKKEDWQFQENILPAKHIAIMRDLAETEWVALMLSRKSFASNMKLETKLRLRTGSQGIGILLSIPSVEERRMLEEGYSLYFTNTECRLYRNNIQVFRASTGLAFNTWASLRIEKEEDVLELFINDRLIFTYTSHLPLSGAFVGLLYKDDSFDLEPIRVFDASHNAYIRCLAVPNAFLSNKLYDLALLEYRRIGHSFPGRQEGREALFRAGITLLEKGKAQRSKILKEQCYHRALKEFGNLYRTSGAPLEYLGKSFVYDALGDSDEEAKCLELALRKFPNHPLSQILKDHILYRMHESSRDGRDAAYRIILLAIRQIPKLLETSEPRELLAHLQNNLEPLPFLEKVEGEELQATAIQLAFWLAKPLQLKEIASTLSHPTLIENTLFCLLELDATQLLEQLLSSLSLSEQGRSYFQALLAGRLPDSLPEQLTRKEERIFCHLLKKALIAKNQTLSDELIKAASKFKWENRTYFDALIAWSFCLRQEWKGAVSLFKFYKEECKKELSPFHFCYSCYLYGTKGGEAAQGHFIHVLDTPYPPTTALPSHFLLGRINGKKGWIEKAFWWEKKELHRQLDFFYHSIGKKK